MEKIGNQKPAICTDVKRGKLGLDMAKRKIRHAAIGGMTNRCLEVGWMNCNSVSFPTCDLRRSLLHAVDQGRPGKLLGNRETKDLLCLQDRLGRGDEDKEIRYQSKRQKGEWVTRKLSPKELSTMYDFPRDFKKSRRWWENNIPL